MVELWYVLIAFMMTVYVVLDGRNFGIGVLHLFVAKTPEERRQVVAAIGPLWSWHEVWLVGLWGDAVRGVSATLRMLAFSGYYLALFLILWCFVLRGMALEVGGHINDRMWQSFWDAVLSFSNVLLGLLFGVALGDLARGAPIGPTGDFAMSFFTDFGVRGDVGLLDWYTVSMGAVCLVILTAHGATYLTWKTEGPVHDRSAAMARRLSGLLSRCSSLSSRRRRGTCARSWRGRWWAILSRGWAWRFLRQEQRPCSRACAAGWSEGLLSARG